VSIITSITARLARPVVAAKAVRTAKILKKLAPLLTSKGFVTSVEHTTTGASVPTAFEGKMAVTDTIKLVMSLGIQKDAKQFKGHTNFTTPDGELVQVSLTKGVSLVSTMPSPKANKF